MKKEQSLTTIFFWLAMFVSAIGRSAALFAQEKPGTPAPRQSTMNGQEKPMRVATVQHSRTPMAMDFSNEQEGDSLVVGAKSKRISFRPRPKSECDLFWITETSAMYRFAGGSRLILDPDEEREPRFFFSGELGLMKNRTENAAIGGTLYFGITSDIYRFGIKGRYRRWMGQKSFLDLVPGVILGGGDSKSDLNLPGLVGHIGVGLSDWIHLSGQIEIMRHAFNQLYVGAPTGRKWTEVSWYGGAKFGGEAGIAGAIVGGLVGLLSATAVPL